MTSIKGHFDGTAVVLDEPAALKVGQAVRVIVEPVPDAQKSFRGAWKGKLTILDDSDDVVLDHFKEYLP